MNLAPWYFLTFFLAPAPTEPVLVPFQTQRACEDHSTEQLTAWGHYVLRNSDRWGPSVDNDSGWAQWTEIDAPYWPFIQGGTKLSFRLHSGPLTVFAVCLSGTELTPESLKSLATSP